MKSAILSNRRTWKQIVSIAAALVFLLNLASFANFNVKAASLIGQPVPATINSYLKMNFQNDPGAATNGGTLSTYNNAYFYPSFSKQSYTFDEGDYLEFDVYMNCDYEFDNYNVNNPLNPMGTADSGFGTVDVFLDSAVTVSSDFKTGEYNISSTNVPKTSQNFRDNPSIVDQNGLSIHPKADVYQYDHKKWYHRKFAIPKEYKGRTAQRWALAAEARNFNPCEVRVANIVVTGSNGLVKAEIATDNTMLGSSKTVNPYDTSIGLVNGTKALTTTGKSVSGATYNNWAVRDYGVVFKNNSLDLSIVDASANPMNANIVDDSARPTSTVSDYVEFYQKISANLTNYQPFADTSASGYQFASGDKIEYDVYLDSTGNGTGGIDVSFAEGSQMSIVDDSTYVDQNGISGNPNSNLSLNAPGKGRWYHRVLAVPETAVNKTAKMWAICNDRTDLAKATNGAQGTGNVTIRIANVVVTNNGTQKLNVFTEKTDFIPCTVNNVTFSTSTARNNFKDSTGADLTRIDGTVQMSIGVKSLLSPITFYREPASHKVVLNTAADGTIFPTQILNAKRVGKPTGATDYEKLGLNADFSRLVYNGKNLDITFKPDAGYAVKSIRYLTNGETVTLTRSELSDSAVSANAKSLTLQNITDAANITTTFALLSNVTASMSAGGKSVTGGDAYTEGETVTLSATPESGYKFDSWEFISGDNDGAVTFNDANSSTASFVMPANAVEVKANFVIADYTIIVNSNTGGTASVLGGANHPHGSDVTITATADAGYSFVKWADGATEISTNAIYTFTADKNASYTAIFSPNTYVITYDYKGATANNAEISKDVVYNEAVGALPAPTKTGCTFDGWYTAENGQGTKYTIDTVYRTVGPITLYANYTVVLPGQKTLKIVQSEQDTVEMVFTADTYIPGDTITLEITPKAGYVVPAGALYANVDGGSVQHINKADGTFQWVVPSFTTSFTVTAKFFAVSKDGVTTFGISKKQPVGETTSASPQDQQSGLQFGSIVYSAVSVDSVTYNLVSSGTILIQGDSLGGNTQQEWYDVLENSATAQRLGSLVGLKKVRTTYQDNTGDYTQYAVRLYGLTENSKASQAYTAFGYAVYSNGSQTVVRFSESKTTAYNSL